MEEDCLVTKSKIVQSMSIQLLIEIRRFSIFDHIIQEVQNSCNINCYIDDKDLDVFFDEKDNIIGVNYYGRIYGRKV